MTSRSIRMQINPILFR